MNKQLLKDGFGWGFILWLIGYILGIALFMILPPAMLGWVIMPIGIFVTLWVLAKKIKSTNFQYYVTVAIMWTLIAIVFDYFFLVKLFKPADGYYKLDVYLYYLLTFALPFGAGLRQMKSNIKFYPALSFLILIILGLGGFLISSSQSKPQVTLEANTNDDTRLKPTHQLQPTPIDETANWNTLTNEYGYTLKYPTPLKVLGDGMNVDETNAPDVTISLNPGDSKDESPFIHINVAEKAGTVYKDMTLAQISKLNYDANLANENVFDKVVKAYAPLVFDGMPAFSYILDSKAYSGNWLGFPAGGSLDNVERITIIESENRGNYFTIVYSTDDPVMTSVISTFKFKLK